MDYPPTLLAPITSDCGWIADNLEDRSPFLRRVVTSPALGRVAAEAMGVPAVRLYMTSLFHKVFFLCLSLTFH